ncbi:hypothetical protein CUC08_Gglean007407 [Alternaria sp. MG1]|nr:hypothetical protein CUC08_Gglean007407 [Alternaria sp. MG1]
MPLSYEMKRCRYDCARALLISCAFLGAGARYSTREAEAEIGYNPSPSGKAHCDSKPQKDVLCITWK